MTKPALRAALAALAATTCLTSCAVLIPPRDEIRPAPAGVTPGGTLTIGIEDPGPLGPVHASSQAARLITSAICDTFVSLDPETNQLKPGLATKYVTAANGSTVTILPDHHLTFPSGTPVGSKLINANLAAQLSPVNRAAAASLIEPFAGGVLAGSEGRHEPVPLLVDAPGQRLTPAQPLNDFDVQLQSAPALSNAVRAFASPAFAPFDQAAFDADPLAFSRDPACIGPYRLTAPVTPGATEIRATRNPDYPAINTAFTSGGAGYLDELVFRIYDSPDAAYSAFRRGEVDIAALPERRATDPKVRPEDVIVAEPTKVAYLGFATRIEFENTAEQRRGFASLLDREALVKDVFGVRARLADGFFPPALARTEGPANSATGAPLAMPTCELPAHDPAAGREHLAHFLDTQPYAAPALAGLAPSPATGLGDANLMTAIAETWRKELGLEFANTVPYDTAGELGASLNDAAAVIGPFEMQYSTTASYPRAMFNDPQPYAAALFTSAGFTTGTNPSGFLDPGIEHLVSSRLGGSEDPVIRQRALEEISATLCRELPMLPLAFVSDVWLINTDAIGSTRSVMTGYDGLPLLREFYRK